MPMPAWKPQLVRLALVALLLSGGCSGPQVETIGFGDGGSGCEITHPASSFPAGATVWMVATFEPLPSSVTISLSRDGAPSSGPTKVDLDGSQPCVNGTFPNLEAGHYEIVINTIPESQMPPLTGEFDVTP
jgi:hypothetical protein